MTTTNRSGLRLHPFGEEMIRRGRNAGPHLLFDWWYSGRLNVEDLRRFVPGVWTDAEWPTSHLEIAQWVEFFQLAASVPDEAGWPLQRPSVPMIVHRGSTWGRRRGMSWTTDLDRAEWFAARWADGGMVFTVTVQPEAVLAIIDERGENEVVVNPSRLPPVRRPA